MSKSFAKKQIRRQIRDTYYELKNGGGDPSPKAICEFLIAFKDNFNEMRQILGPEKNSEDPWSREIWRLLEFDNANLEKELEQIVSEKNFSIESTKMQLRTRFNNLINLDIPISTTGPNYTILTTEKIETVLKSKLEEPIAHFKIDISNVIEFPGTYSFTLEFDDKSTYLMELTLRITGIPKLLVEIEKYITENKLTASPDVQSDSEIRKLLSQEVLAMDELAVIYYTAHQFGFSKTIEANRILRRWYTLIDEKNREFEYNSNSISDISLSDSTNVIEGLSEEEIEKIKVLNLPPLVLNDLMNATGDEKILIILANSFPEYKKFRQKRIQQLTSEDVRSLSPRGRWKMSELMVGKTYADPRTVAIVAISIARLFFDKQRIGTIETDIRYCLSYYCTQYGRYLIEQHRRYDIARELFIEAITLNRTGGGDLEFPASLLFRSFVGTKNLPYPHKQRLIDDIKFIEHQPTEDNGVLKIAVRSILELGIQHQDFALKWFLNYEDETKRRFLDLAWKQLKISRFADLPECISSYQKQMNEVHALLLHLKNSNSIQAIVQNKNILQKNVESLGFLINPTNLEIFEIIKQAIFSLENHLGATQYANQKSNLETAKNQLEKTLSFGADNYTTLWAQHFQPIANRWIQIIDEKLAAMSKGNFAFIKVSLAEQYISCYERPDLTRGFRAIYQIENSGNAPAKRVNIDFSNVNNKELITQKSNFDLGANEVAEDYFSVEDADINDTLKVNYSGTFYNLDGKKTEFTDDKPLLIQRMKSNDNLKKIVNPFQADREVDDEKMFVGRSSLLEEVSTYAINQPSGTLLMLHGQRRVGKSSLLLFIEKNIDLVSLEKKILGVKISWLNYTTHKAHHLWHAIAKEIKYKLKKHFELAIEIPDANAFEESYTVAFNTVLDELRFADLDRIILLWDEFDGLVNLIDKDEYNYDRLFFEYLRGLSKRKYFTLILTGGELMPILFERWGEVFNHDRTWRIAYLSSTDDSVEKLVRNEYINEIVTFSEEAINLIKYYSACNPFFIQMICRDLIDSAKENNSPHVCKLDVEEIVERLVKRNLEIKYVKHLYTPRLEPDPLDLAIIGVVAQIEIESKGKKYIEKNKIFANFPKRSEDKVINKLGELVRREILDQNPNNNNEYRIKLPLFRDWFYDNNPEYELWVSELKRVG